MPVLKNPRHERYAQELAKGQSQVEAYAAAGYSRSKSCASELLSSKPYIHERVAEIQGETANKSTDKMASVTRADVLSELLKIGMANVGEDAVRAADKRAALLNYAQIEGWVIERREIGEPGEFSAMDESSLMEEIMRDAAEAGVPFSLDESTTQH